MSAGIYSIGSDLSLTKYEARRGRNKCCSDEEGLLNYTTPEINAPLFVIIHWLLFLLFVRAVRDAFGSSG